MTLTENETLLLEEYKNCTQVLLNANGLLWTRFNIYLVFEAALLASWTALTIYYPEKLAALAVAFFGLLSSLTWLFVGSRAQGYQDLWYERLKEIEESFKWRLQTFDELRAMKFWVDESYLRRRQMRIWQPVTPVFFLLIWSFFILLSNLNLFDQVIPGCGILLGTWITIGAALLYSHSKDHAKIGEERQNIKKKERERKEQKEKEKEKVRLEE